MLVRLEIWSRKCVTDDIKTGIFKFAAILDAVMLLIIFFCLPETLFLRSQRNLRTADEPLYDARLTKKTYANRLALWSNHPELHLKANQFVIPAFKVSCSFEKSRSMKLMYVRWRGIQVYYSPVSTMQHSMDSQAFCRRLLLPTFSAPASSGTLYKLDWHTVGL